MAGTRSYVAGSFFFSLDGIKCGFVKSVDGGDVSADVIEEPPKSGTSFTKKHIGQPKYSDIELSVGFGMTQSFYDWIAASWQLNYQRKNGSIVAADLSLQAKSERQFFNALVTETTIPALDAASKDPAYLTVSFSPEYTRDAKASGKLAPEKTPTQKAFLPSNFRLELDGLDCSKVSKIDSFTVKQTVATDDIGDARDMQKEPGKLEVPNLRVAVAEVAAATWSAWFEDFVIKGNNDDAHEKSGAIVFLAPNRKDELGRVILHNVGIFALRHEAATEKISHVVAELYCEQMELQVGKPAVEEIPYRGN
jgi:T4-like virus tail tube protein gp19.